MAGLGAKVPGLVAPAPCPVNNGGGEEHDWSTPVEAGCTATVVCGSETTDGAGSGCQAGLGPHAGELERAGSLIQSTTGQHGNDGDWSAPVEPGCTSTAVGGSAAMDGAGSGCHGGLGPHTGELERAGCGGRCCSLSRTRDSLLFLFYMKR